MKEIDRYAVAAPMNGRAFVLDNAKLGISGFFMSLGGLETPLFLKGDPTEFRVVSNPTSACIVILHLGRSVHLINPQERTVATVYGSFRKSDCIGTTAVISDPDYPLVGETPDRVRIDFKVPVMQRDIGHVAKEPIYEMVKQTHLRVSG